MHLDFRTGVHIPKIGFSTIFILQIYDFAESDDSCNLKFKWYRRRTLADKMYEFCSEDEEDTENIHPLTFQLGNTNSLGLLRSTTALYKEFSPTSAHKSCDIDLEDGDRISVTSQTSDCSDFAESHLPISSSSTRCPIDSPNLLVRDKGGIYDDNESSSSVNQNLANYSKLIGSELYFWF